MDVLKVTFLFFFPQKIKVGYYTTIDYALFHFALHSFFEWNETILMECANEIDHVTKLWNLGDMCPLECATNYSIINLDCSLLNKY
jgi:hypothetical protein